MPATPAAAQDAALGEGWDSLGNVRLKPGGWENTVEGMVPETVNKVRIDVTGADLDMSDIRLAFENGTVWSMKDRVKFREGSRTFLFELPDAAHQIRRIGFTYRCLTPHAEPLVQVYGRYTERAATVINWMHLGAREIDFAQDRGEIEVSADDTLRGLRFWVDSADVDLSNVKVTYGDGAVVKVPGMVPVQARRGRAVDLPGSGGVVRRVEFTYHSPFKGTQGKQMIHVYGRP
jgi:hypothetical protein